MLVVEPDPMSARRMVASLGDGCAGLVPSRRVADDAPSGAVPTARCVVVGTFREVFEADLDRAQLVICSVTLPDATGLAVLDYLRTRRPALPVILVGSLEESGVAIEAIRAGAVDFLTTSGHDLQALPLAVEKCLAHQRVRQENERLQRDLSDSLAELAMKNQQLQALVRRLESTARTDDLTGLCNRRSLNELLGQAWDAAAASRRSITFLMIDLDDFKVVNDRLGHLRGDEVLRETARIIQANCRQGDVAARYGGDEFCVLLSGADANEARQLALRILRECDMAGTDRPEPGPSVRMSIGIAHVDHAHPGDATIEALVHRADEALYAAKAAGKCRIVVHGECPCSALVIRGLAVKQN